MKDQITWYDRYQIALKEVLSIKDIMKLRDVGQPTAIKIRNEAIEYCLKNDIALMTNKVPCEIVMIITNKDLDYYHEKMILEYESLNLKKELSR